ncbi:MAG: DciA family protein [Paralcaligenes sp.]
MPRPSRQPPREKPTPDSLSAISWLSGDQRSAGVLTTARMLLSIEHAAKTILPPALAQVCRVARVDRQQVTLAVPSAAYAARLRQLAPRIAQMLTQGGWNINEISVKVQAGLLQTRTNPAPIKDVTPLDERALSAFEALQNNLRPGPLADAVKRLLAHHRS